MGGDPAFLGGVGFLKGYQLSLVSSVVGSVCVVAFLAAFLAGAFLAAFLATFLAVAGASAALVVTLATLVLGEESAELDLFLFAFQVVDAAAAFDDFV